MRGRRRRRFREAGGDGGGGAELRDGAGLGLLRGEAVGGQFGAEVVQVVFRLPEQSHSRCPPPAQLALELGHVVVDRH